MVNITHETKDRVTRTPLKTGGELRCSRRVNSSCSTNVMLFIISDKEHQLNYFLLYFFFFSVDNLNKSTNGNNSVGGISLYVWVYLMYEHLNEHSIQPNITIRWEPVPEMRANHWSKWHNGGPNILWHFFMKKRHQILIYKQFSD
jgi:hypothetical protein